MKGFLIFPHQLFEAIHHLQKYDKVFLIEEYLFFHQYSFHKQKLLFHKSTIAYYKDYLTRRGLRVIHINSEQKECDIRKIFDHPELDDIIALTCYNVIDNWLNRRIKESCANAGVELDFVETPMFLSTTKDLDSLMPLGKKRYLHHDFYVQQRKRLNILVQDQKPVGGKWSFDSDNRKKYPRKKLPPHISLPKENTFDQDARVTIEKEYPNNNGTITGKIYPTTHKEALIWLEDFLGNRLFEFGDYEDAIVRKESYLHHSVLTPMLNIGLLTPQQVISRTLAIAESQHTIPLNSLEGFIRQVIGWREFMRGMYDRVGTTQRTMNFWGFTRKIPKSFYTASTGILPIDQTIAKLLKTGYCHHIERLMVLGNFMLLCEFEPNDVYVWFMEMFIDAYDWVMVPNVYGMSQFADGGLFATKPYISGSNYIRKMSDYPKGEWQQIWDGLFWRFMDKQRLFFLKNPRLAMLVRMFDKMPVEKQNHHRINAENYLRELDRMS